MCVNTLLDYAYDKCNIEAPGFSSAKIALAEWIDAFPALDDYPTTGAPNTISTDITLDTVTHEDAIWADVLFAKDQNSLNTELADNDGAKYYTSTIEAFIPGNEELGHHVMHQMAQGELVIQVTTKSGKNMILGNPDNPVDLLFKWELNKTTGEKVGFTLTFTWKAHSRPIPFYTGAALA